MLSNIKNPHDLRAIQSINQLNELSTEIRGFLINTLSEIDHAHFSANLGVVELTLALHYSFETPEDLLFWDIGHQGYVHKMLTGRLSEIVKIRTKTSVSGFLSRSESVYDVFGAGHAGTSISAALGASIANKIRHSKVHHVAIIGDASLGSGMAFEALNHLSDLKNINLTVVINDNNCSIDASVGGMSKHLQHLANSSIDQTIFENLGLAYAGPYDGHDLESLIDVFSACKKTGGIHVIHCITKKGKGYFPAENGMDAHWHAPGKFDANTGANLSPAKTTRYQDVFAATLIALATDNPKIVAITAGMLSGTSLGQFQKHFPDRCFDVGIAEQHAVTLAAGLSTQGVVPFCAIYSTFMQRGFDQVIHDVALQNLPVVFCVDRAGLVGHDGATHQGVFDIAFFRIIPNLFIASPSNAKDLKNLLYSSQEKLSGPLVIRYPRGKVDAEVTYDSYSFIEIGKGRCLQKGKDLLVFCLGTVLNEALLAIKALEKNSVSIGLYDMIFVKPLDEALLHEALAIGAPVVTIEEGTLIGGFGSSIAEFILTHGYKNKLVRLGLPDEFISHGSQNEQREEYGLDAKGIAKQLSNLL